MTTTKKLKFITHAVSIFIQLPLWYHFYSTMLKYVHADKETWMLFYFYVATYAFMVLLNVTLNDDVKTKQDAKDTSK